MGLHVQLDVEYASDEKMVDAGPLAELLYIRALCFAKKNPKNDGEFSATQLSLFAHGIPGARKCAEKLTTLGAWEVTPKGWRIAVWLRRNKSGADIATAQEMASALGVKGNHERWHVGPEGKPSAKCALCVAAYRLSGTPIGSGSGHPIGSASPKEEVEEQEKTETEEEPAAAGESVGSGDEADDVAAAAIELLIAYRVATTARTNPAGLERALRRDLPTEYAAEIARHLKWHPNATAADIAGRLLGVPGLGNTTIPPAPDWHADPHCEHCDGSGIARLDDIGQGTYGPCECRRTEPYPDADVIEMRWA